ncbi:hypothetical protein Val02_63070 [Virgisporangium aliadipatigenens]|uniref:HD Cas3-type domain-containing protein n=1 Tax=Virgisporangium aliadipatigenens TaxID=741659 RepID=A0A8J4DTL4_9ACTN|nr:type I-U CRISPR-associated helicase/endonuclease Cas3 [Virgisporangium aliadipatigenens]GIJ49421.1 hypothetical protein Val02_63070 [Virgisporangium aliadipatigenens]
MLTADDFVEFYAQVHQRRPFAWQRDLVDTVLRDNAWPDLVDVPTGMGKTSMLDVSVFVTAASAAKEGAGRVGRRRCLFVVDRRIVVDEATEHASTIAAALRRAEAQQRSGSLDDGGVAARVAAALRSLAPDAVSVPPLTVTRMRGGTTWAAEWLPRPDLPGIVISTVDQVGSRLLFRGYGISGRRRPIDAALVGTDALLLVDEAHLATALLDTAAALRERDRSALPVPGLQVVRLTATARREVSTDTGGGRRYPFDLEAHRDDVEAMRRLSATKRVFPLLSTPKTVAAVMAAAARRLASTGSPVNRSGWAPTVLVVCNTVDRARTVHSLIDKAVRTEPADVDLLIGRSRPADRDELVERIAGRFGLRRSPSERASILVATQTVEVGVNLDVDALVTESASWDALVQRLGRLNRLGRAGERIFDRSATALVVHDGEPDGPVYGAARDRTWEHLCRLVPAVSDLAAIDDTTAWLDMSPQAVRTVTASLPSDVAAPRPDVPVLQVPTLDAWVRTAPAPLGDTPVDVFLHGFGTGAAGVQVAWRDGLLIDDPLDDPFEDSTDTSTRAANLLLSAMPIRTAEQVEVPFVALRQWMAGFAVPPVADVESAPDIDVRPQQVRDDFQVLAWRDIASAGSASTAGDAATAGWVWISAAQLRPGDQIVVPSARGGLDRYGWCPTSLTRVSDRCEVAAFRSGRPLLRITTDLADRLGITGPDRVTLQDAINDLYRSSADDPASEAAEHLIQTLQATLTTADGAEAASTGRLPIGLTAAQIVAWLDTGPQMLALGDEDRAAVVGGFRSPTTVLWLLTGGRAADGDPGQDPPRVPGVEGDDDHVAGSSVSTTPVGLDQHGHAVGQRAAAIAAALRLPPDLARTIVDAARWHDVGKAEPRFQIMLHNGDSLTAALAAEPLAKSGMSTRDRTVWRLARQRSGLPPRARHEAWSAGLIREYLRQRAEPYPGDADLLIHLIASHHGHARPWLPLVQDNQPTTIEHHIDEQPVKVTSAQTVFLDHPARFARLNARYGRWGLALLETIVRCADTTISAEGS